MRNYWNRFISGFLLLTLTVCCKPALNANNVASITPIKVDSKKNDEPTVDWGDSKVNDNHKLNSHLILSLDYIPESDESIHNKLLCLEPLTAKFGVIAKAVCKSNPSIAYPITAEHLRQECYTDPGHQPILSKKRLEIRKCDEVRILGYRFNPELRIDIEPILN